MQRMWASACLVLGVFVLFGFGWALLAAGVLLWFRDERAAVWLAERRKDAVDVGALLATRMRASLAGASMGVGMVLAPVGAAVIAGAAIGLMVAAGLLLIYGYVTGWGA